MKTITKNYQVYTYDELSETAKEKVREKFRIDDTDIETQMLEEDLKYRITEDYPFFSDVQFQWSLGYCQGDGLSFSASIDLNGYLDYKREDKNSKAYQLRTSRYDALCNAVWNLHSTGNTGHYCYAAKSDIDFDYNYCDGRDRPRLYALLDEIVDEIRELYVDICYEYEKYGYRAYEYLGSDEYARDTSEANEYTYLDDGTMFNG